METFKLVGGIFITSLLCFLIIMRTVEVIREQPTLWKRIKAAFAFLIFKVGKFIWAVYLIGAFIAVGFPEILRCTDNAIAIIKESAQPISDVEIWLVSSVPVVLFVGTLTILCWFFYRTFKELMPSNVRN